MHLSFVQSPGPKKLPVELKLIRVLFAVLAMSGSLLANPAKIHRSKTQGIPGEFIVALADNIPSDAVDGVAQSLTATYNLTLHEVWADSLRGFFATGEDIAVDALSDDPRVKYVEQNVRMELDASRVSATQCFRPNLSLVTESESAPAAMN